MRDPPASKLDYISIRSKLIEFVLRRPRCSIHQSSPTTTNRSLVLSSLVSIGVKFNLLLRAACSDALLLINGRFIANVTCELTVHHG